MRPCWNWSPALHRSPCAVCAGRSCEVVVPAAQGERYRENAPAGTDDAEDDADEPMRSLSAGHADRVDRVDCAQSLLPARGLGTQVERLYYTPERFVRFLVEQTLGPVLDKCSPRNDPNPAAILKLKVVDPAMGSGHFLVDACRVLGARLYEACRACDLRAAPAERRAEAAIDDEVRATAIAEAAKYRGRLTAVAGPDGELLSYLPSRVVEGGGIRRLAAARGGALPPPGGRALSIRRGQECARRRTGEADRLDRSPCRRAAAHVPGPPACRRRFAHRAVLRTPAHVPK